MSTVLLCIVIGLQLGHIIGHLIVVAMRGE